jgi:hypothetical protein
MRTAIAGAIGVALVAACKGKGAATSGSTSSVWRLSTENQKSVCNACKGHAEHRYFTSAALAAANRAHKGCNCEVRESPADKDLLERVAAGASNGVFDDRWPAKGG